MGRVTTPLVLSFSLLLGLQVASADENASGTKPTQQRDTQAIRYRPRLHRRAIRHWQGTPQVTNQMDLRHTEEERLPIRVYHLKYVSAIDVEAVIGPLKSSVGIITVPSASDVEPRTCVIISGGSGGGGGGSGRNPSADGEIITVQDHEQNLKTMDRVIAQIDVQPAQVLIEASIVEVTLNKESESGINLSVLDGAGKLVNVVRDGAVINAAAGFTPAAAIAPAAPLADTDTETCGFAEDNNDVKLGCTGNGTDAFLHALESYGETRILATPRILVLNKQRAEFHLGQELGGETGSVSQSGSTENASALPLGTHLRLRPFVSSDGMVRLEIHFEHTTGRLDENQVPQTTTSQCTSNVLVPDGTTIVMGGLLGTETAKDWEGFRAFSQLPYLGSSFRHGVDTVTKKKLVVLITPRVWRQ